MAGVFRTSTAERDLGDIWDYIARDNVDAAGKLLRDFEAQANRYAESPALGARCSEFSAGLRNFTFGHYVGFYVPVSDGIQIIRVLHRARDLPSLFVHEDERD